MILLKKFAALVIAAALCAPAASAQGWYCSRAEDNRRPACPYDEKMLAGNNAVYIGADEKKVYLTFDAGYENGNVEKICGILEKHGATGAFFVLKHFVKANPELTERLAANGNLICNHSLSHRDPAKLSETELKDEILGMEKLYRELTGREMAKYFRPPEGSFTEGSLKTTASLGYKTVFWSLAYADWDNSRQPDPEKALELLLKRVHNGAVILLHPTSATNAAILDRFLSELEGRGYSFGSLDEL